MTPSDALRLSASWREVLAPAVEKFEERLLPYVVARRWFRGKSRRAVAASVPHAPPLPTVDAVIGIVRIEYAVGAPEEYCLPLTGVCGAEAARIRETAPHLVVCDYELDDRTRGIVCDALGLAWFDRALIDLLDRQAVLGDSCTIRFRPIGERFTVSLSDPRTMTAEQSNTSILFGTDAILKVTRRIEDGVGADLEMGEFLTRAGYAHAPAVLATAEICRPPRAPATMAIVHAFVRNEGDAWPFFCGLAQRAIDAGGAFGAEERARLRVLAVRVAELHRALGHGEGSAFRPERIEKSERAALGQHVLTAFDRAAEALSTRAAALPEGARSTAGTLAGRRPEMAARIAAFVDMAGALVKTRIHGDLHLGQILVTQDDFVIIDFEGEPGRPLAERKAKRCPLADVAGIVRSLHYASVAAARASSNASSSASGSALRSASSGASTATAAERWHEKAVHAFVDAYNEETRNSPSLPDADEGKVALDYYLLEKCVYEIQYELDNRPDWVELPLLGLARVLESRR